MCVMWWVFIEPSDIAVVVRHWVVIKLPAAEKTIRLEPKSDAEFVDFVCP